MNESVNKLRQIARNVTINKVSLLKGDNLNKIYLREGAAGVQRVLQDASGVEEVTEVKSAPLPVQPLTPIKVEDVVFIPTEEESAPLLDPEQSGTAVAAHKKSTHETKKPSLSVIKNSAAEENYKRTQQRFKSFMNEKPEKRTESKDEADISEEAGIIDFDQPILEIVHEGKLLLRTPVNHYNVLGNITQDLSSMYVTLMVEELASGRKERTKIELYERDNILLYSERLADLFEQDTAQIEKHLLLLTDLLEQHRDNLFETIRQNGSQFKKAAPSISSEKKNECIEFLSKPDLINRIDKLIEQAGVVGEESTRRSLFVIASTYKMNTPLHALVQGTSGSGKSHLINVIGSCFPPEDVISMTRVTSKSFYHYTKDELVNKLILIQDYDGLDEEAQFAFRELQSSGNISSSTTYKDRYGNLLSTVKNVRSHFASLLATTKGEVYYDNMSRSMVLGVDESDEQTKRIINFHNRNIAGLTDQSEAKRAKTFLQNCMRLIKYHDVVNPYADKVFLPFEAKMLRRLNSHFQAFVKQVAVLHQYQRERDALGRIVATPEDLMIACEVMFDAILLKVDDLDSSLRQFFDRLKDFVRQMEKEQDKEGIAFTQRDVRLSLKVSKTQCFRYFEELENLEYIQRTGGYANKGFKYRVAFWDDLDKVRAKIKSDLQAQLQKIDPSMPPSLRVPSVPNSLEH